VEKEAQIAAALPDLALKIIDHVTQHGRVTIGEMLRVTGASRNTLKEHFRSLVAKRHLARHGTGKGAWYTLL
jgi:DeoR/GlpR family transcriptional regulator of sugar metabolism